MINYSGSLTFSGSLADSLGESGTVSGSLGITLSATFNSSATGTAAETVSGDLDFAYTYGGYSGIQAIPFNLSTPPFPLQLGNFVISQPGPVGLRGVEFGVRLQGYVSVNLQAITEYITAYVSGSYQGVEVAGEISARGVLRYIPAPPIISGTGPVEISGTASVAPFSRVTITDPNPTPQTDTVILTQSAVANGTLSNLGGFNATASPGVYTLTGTAAQVSAALEGMVFTPNAVQGPAGSTVTTDFTISVTNSLGLSATDSGASLEATIPGFVTLDDFNGTDGAEPSGLFSDTAGDLFGVTSFGGASDEGSVFVIAKTSTGYASTPTRLASFNFTDGYLPVGGVIADSAGDLFGATMSGGTYNDGTVFVLANSPAGYATAPDAFISFNGADGSQPYAGLIADAAGDLFGTTHSGGLYGDGVVFEIVKSSTGYAGTPTILLNFNGSDGANPEAALLIDAAGDLFGTTYAGGTSGYGTVFEIAKTSGTYSSTPTILANFNFTNGANTTAGLVADAQGDLFGTTEGGGSAVDGFVTYEGEGTVFEIAKQAGGYGPLTTLADFNLADGGMPDGKLLVDAAGNLFGTTSAGGLSQQGTVFEIAKTNGAYASAPIPLTLFNGFDGSDPEAGLTVDAAGDLIGTTAGGGTLGDGTLFELNYAQKSTGYVIDPVTITGTAANQVTSDRLSISPFRNVVVADTRTGQTETVTLTQSAVTDGTLSDLGGFSLTNSPGVYTYTGSAAQVTAALDGLVFMPTEGQVAAGQSVATTFTIQDTDTAGFTAVDSKTSVIAAPPVTIRTDDGTSLVKIATQYALYNSSGVGPWLQYQGNFVIAGGLGAWTPIGAVQDASGYLVAWQSGTGAAAQYVVWQTDSNGNYLSEATGVGSGSNFALEEIEPTFGQDLNGDGTIGTGPVTKTIQTDNGTSLVQIGNDFAMRNSSGIGPALQLQGSTVTVGGLGAWNPIGAVQLSGGLYLVAWQSGTGASAQYVVWETDSNGNYLSEVTGVVTGSSFALQELEFEFGRDLNNDGTMGPAKGAPIATDNGTSLVPVGNEFALDNSSGVGPTLRYQGSAVLVGALGAWTPIGAVQDASGYLVAWRSGTGASAQYVVWQTDSNGNYLSQATGVVSGSNFALEEIEPTFAQDLNGDGTVGTGPVTKTIQTDNGTSLVQIGNDYALRNSSGVGPALQYQGSAVTVGELGTWAPIGAVQDASGYLVAWKSGAAASARYVVWQTDSNGNYLSQVTGVVSGTDYTLEALEPTFGQDLNGDTTTGPVNTTIATDGGTNLVLTGNRYALDNSSDIGPMLQYQGSAVTVGGLGAWTPIGAVQDASGYLVAWRSGTGAAAQYVVWQTDSNGNYLSQAIGVVSGSNFALEEIEPTFGQDLNGDGTTGTSPVTKTIQTDNGTSLVQIGNDYALRNSSGIGPALQYQGSAVTVGGLGTWAPIGAVQDASGYLVAWQSGTGAAAQYVVWQTDSNGNYLSQATGVVSDTNFALEEIEPTFGQDLNGDGTTGTSPVTKTIQTDKGTSLVQIGNDYALRNSSGIGPALQYQDSAVTAGELGAWNPIGAVQNASGYLVAWQSGTGAAAQYVIWQTDSNGNYLSEATGVVLGTDYTLEAYEPTFGQDLNGDGTTGPTATPIATDNGTSLFAADNQFFLGNSSGPGPVLKYQGTAVTVGGLGGWTPLGAVGQSGGGFLVAWKMAGQDQYVVWSTDSNGNYMSEATAVVSGEDFSLEDLEPVFGQRLNGEGTGSTVLDTTTGAGGVLNLTGQTQATTINLGENTASASSGLNAPSLSFIGTPDAITLGSGAAKIEYTLAQSSGIETIANFVYGQDELNIDLQGVSPAFLQAYDTTVGGVHAITIANSTDLTQGVVLLNMTGGQTAANLLASHTTFVGGHALIS